MSGLLQKNVNNEVDLSVIGPAMNEAGNLEEYVERCLKAFKDKNLNGEIIIVDDGSNDKTNGVLQKIIDQHPDVVRGFKHRKNLGLTQALKTGFANARGAVILWISTDLESHPDEDIQIFMEAFAEGADVVAGYRKDRKDGKNLASKIYNLVCKKLFKLKLRDMNWTKAFKRECLPYIHLRGDWHRFILMMLHVNGFKIVEREMQWYPRTYGKSKFGAMRFPRAFIDAISIWFILFFSRKPMRLFGAIGAGLIFLGVIIHLFLVFYYLISTTQIRPLFWGALVSELMGVQFILFGFISELIERVKDDLDGLKYHLHCQKGYWTEMHGDNEEG